jgi:hypothetical protein
MHGLHEKNENAAHIPKGKKLNRVESTTGAAYLTWLAIRR